MIDRSIMPPRIARLPVDDRGYPVPRFVTWFGDKPDFRLADTAWLRRAISERRCFLCGEPLGRFMAFVIGPMCAINRISSEPPSHKECAEYAVRACPFLCFPQRGRNSHDMPENKVKPAGFMITRNPGVALVWITKQYVVMHSPIDRRRGCLLEIGDAVERSWWTQGRPATLAEVLASIDSGLPELRRIAAEHDGPDGAAELEQQIAATIQIIEEEMHGSPSDR
jgi:hypothetical protein